MNVPLFLPPSAATPPVEGTAATKSAARRIKPWRMFLGSMVPNWLQRRPEISQGAKLAYGRLAQYAGEDGKCFPKQKTLAAELGVSERTANSYVRKLVEAGLIQSERPGLGLSNHYFFLDHPWMYEGEFNAPSDSDQHRTIPSGPNRQASSALDRKQTSGPGNKENHYKENPCKRVHPHCPPVGDCLAGTIPSVAVEEQIYQAFPKKVGRPAALRAIRRALKGCPFDVLFERTRRYAAECNAPLQFIPNPATWFGQERFNDDPSTWRRSVVGNHAIPPAIIRADKFGCGSSKL